MTKQSCKMFGTYEKVNRHFLNPYIKEITYVGRAEIAFNFVKITIALLSNYTHGACLNTTKY